MYMLFDIINALCFTLWPFVGRYTGVSGSWVLNVALIGTMATAMGYDAYQATVTNSWGTVIGSIPDPRKILFLLIAGLINGAGCILYAKFATDPDMNPAIYVATNNALMIVWAPLIGLALNKEPLFLEQMIGIAIILMGIAVMNLNTIRLAFAN